MLFTCCTFAVATKLGNSSRMATEREPAEAKIVVDDFDGDGREVWDHLRARLYIDDVPTHKITFGLSHLDFMTSNTESVDDIDEIWDRAIEEMSRRLVAELTYAGLVRFTNPINVQSHLTSLRVETPRRGLRKPGTVLGTFEI